MPAVKEYKQASQFVLSDLVVSEDECIRFLLRLGLVKESEVTIKGVTRTVYVAKDQTGSERVLINVNDTWLTSSSGADAVLRTTGYGSDSASQFIAVYHRTGATQLSSKPFFFTHLGCCTLESVWSEVKDLNDKLYKKNYDKGRASLVMFSARTLVLFILADQTSHTGKALQLLTQCDFDLTTQTSTKKIRLLEYVVARITEQRRYQNNGQAQIPFRPEGLTEEPKQSIPTEIYKINQLRKPSQENKAVARPAKVGEIYTDAGVKVGDSNRCWAVKVAYNPSEGVAYVDVREGYVSTNVAEVEAISLGAIKFPGTKVIYTDCEDAQILWDLYSKEPLENIDLDSEAFPLRPVYERDIEVKWLAQDSCEEMSIADQLTVHGRYREHRTGRYRVNRTQTGYEFEFLDVKKGTNGVTSESTLEGALQELKARIIEKYRKELTPLNQQKGEKGHLVGELEARLGKARSDLALIDEEIARVEEAQKIAIEAISNVVL